MSNGQQQKDNAGALFKNDRKENEKQPDYKGSLMINGVDYWLSAWINVSQKDGKTKYMSLSATPKEAAPSALATTQPAKPKPRTVALDQEPDDIPF
jgi:hypothetical protein